jgi:integrase
MARKTTRSPLETRTGRLRLEPRKKPYFWPVAPGVSVAYRKTVTPPGSWSVRCADGKGGSRLERIGIADDLDGVGIDFATAVDKAREHAPDDGTDANERPATVAEAVDAYEVNLRARGRDVGNATRVRSNLPDALAARPVALLRPKELRGWRDHLVQAGMKPAGADRTARGLKAALKLAADDDSRIRNTAAWRVGLKRLPDGEEARNVIVSDAQVLAVIDAGYAAVGADYGLFNETAANTGVRRSQLLRVRIDDLQDGGAAPRLLVPSSRKGRSNRKPERKALPISPALAAKLRAAAIGRPADAPLLVQSNGKPWQAKDYGFKEAAAAAGLDASLTPICLRHSSIVRQLLAGIPTRIVASSHDTSVSMIERHYAKYIVGDPSDAMVRKTLLDAGTPAQVNVVPLPARKA